MNSQPPSQGGKKTLLVVDWDNVFMGLCNDCGLERIRLQERIGKMAAWIQDDVSPLISVGGFIFAPEHLNRFHKKVFTQHSCFKFIICPKTDSGKDTVDEEIISFCLWAIQHPEVGYLCLASADNGFYDLFQKAQALGVKRALVIPSLNSLKKKPKGGRLVDCIDNHPLTGKKMAFRLDLCLNSG